MYQIHKVHRKKLLERFPGMANVNIYKYVKKTIGVGYMDARKNNSRRPRKITAEFKKSNFASYFFPKLINVLSEISVWIVSREVGASQSLPIINDVINFYIFTYVTFYWKHSWFSLVSSGALTRCFAFEGQGAGARSGCQSMLDKNHGAGILENRIKSWNIGKSYLG